MSKERETKQDWIHPDDSPLLSSKNDFLAFKSTTIWRDIEQLILDRQELLMNQLIYAQDDKRIYELQTEIRTLTDMLEVPDYLAERCDIEKPHEEE